MTAQSRRAYRGRFAPSPTGELHFGSLLAALASSLQAHRHQGSWLIRIDDIDPPREVAGASSAIVQSLADHGFNSTLPTAYQSQRTHRYQEAINKLSAKGLVYGCDCSRKQLAEANWASGRCPGNCQQRALSLDDHAVRFITNGIESFEDKIMGPMTQDIAREVGDFVIKRRDGLYAYQLASVVDDGEDKITEIVRGADLLDNTPRQIALFRALGYTIPSFMHIPIAVDANNQKLSKQTQALQMHADHALTNLCAAWSFLGQNNDGDLSQLTSCTDFWAMAKIDWKPSLVPTFSAIEVDSAFYR